MINEKTDDGNLQKRFDELNERTLGKDATESVDGIQVVQLRLKLFRVEMPARLKDVDGEADHHDGHHDGECRTRQDDNHAKEEIQDGLDIDRLIQMTEDIHRILRDVCINLLPDHLDDEKADEQHECRADFLALADLALLRRVLAFFCRRLFRLVAVSETLQVERKRPPVEELIATAGPAERWRFFHTSHRTCPPGTSRKTARASRARRRRS